MKTIEVAGCSIGHDHPCFIIAEAGVNHNGSVVLAKQLVDAAVKAGADAVKFQTFRAERVVSQAAPKAIYQRETTSPDESQLEMVKRLELSTEAHRKLQAYCQEQGILFMSTPFDKESVDLLDELAVPAFKIGSGEITNWPFLEYVTRKHRPIILSTGMSYLSEVDEAVRVIREAGGTQLVLLHCVSNYPADPANTNLRAMKTLEAAFRVPVGYSDHTPGFEVAMAAVALGACVLEKHFTLDRSLPGPDQKASLEPEELEALINGVRRVETALGAGQKEPASSEIETASVARRSLVAAQDIPPGTVLTSDMIAIKRPGTGLAPAMRLCLVGRTARVAIAADTLLTLEMIV